MYYFQKYNVCRPYTCNPHTLHNVWSYILIHYWSLCTLLFFWTLLELLFFIFVQEIFWILKNFEFFFILYFLLLWCVVALCIGVDEWFGIKLGNPFLVHRCRCQKSLSVCHWFKNIVRKHSPNSKTMSSTLTCLHLRVERWRWRGSHWSRCDDEVRSVPSSMWRESAE